MGENEKLGFTFEVAPYDFKDFNRFFGTTTNWVDGECNTQVWNGSQRPNCEDYLKVREVIAPNGTRVIPKEEFMQELGGKPHEMKFDIPNCKVSYKGGMIVVDELPEDIIRTNISTADAEFKHLSEKTAKAFEESCNDYLETLSEVSKSLSPCLERLIAQLGKTPKRKAREHYKPKFTL